MKKLQYIYKIDYIDYNKKHSNKIIQKKYSEYYEYLEKISQTIDPNLYEAYIKSDRFHDYRLKRIKYNTCKNTLSISFFDYGIIYENAIIEFKNVSKCSIGYDFVDDDIFEWRWKDCIVLCEIGFYNGKNYFGFSTADGVVLDVYFENVQIKFKNSKIINENNEI